MLFFTEPKFRKLVVRYLIKFVNLGILLYVASDYISLTVTSHFPITSYLSESCGYLINYYSQSSQQIQVHGMKTN